MPPPGGEAQLARVQDWCFRTYGCPSAHALPASVPLFWRAQTPTQPSQQQVRVAESGATTAREYAGRDGRLFLALEEPERWARLRTALAPVFPGSAATPLFELFAGFFLCDGVPSSAPLPPPPSGEPVRFHRLDLAAMSVRYAESPQWWRQVEWEQLWRLRCLPGRS